MLRAARQGCRTPPFWASVTPKINTARLGSTYPERPHAISRPRIPTVDVIIGSADTCLSDADQNVRGTNSVTLTSSSDIPGDASRFTSTCIRVGKILWPTSTNCSYFLPQLHNRVWFLDKSGDAIIAEAFASKNFAVPTGNKHWHIGPNRFHAP